MKRLAAMLLATALLLGLTACHQPAEDPVHTAEVGESVSTYWFDYTLTRVKLVDHWGDYVAGEGERLLLCDLRLESTVDSTVPMGWDDFLLRWGATENSIPSEALAPLPWCMDGQLPDEFDLDGKGAEEQGLLIYRVPDEVEEVAFAFQERFNEGESDSRYTAGDTFLTWIDLDQLQSPADAS